MKKSQLNKVKTARCVFCGREFLKRINPQKNKKSDRLYVRQYNAKTCSKKCSRDYSFSPMRRKISNGQYYKKLINRVNRINHKTKMEKCAVCGKLFLKRIKPHKYSDGVIARPSKSKTCSKDCSREYYSWSIKKKQMGGE